MGIRTKASVRKTLTHSAGGRGRAERPDISSVWTARAYSRYHPAREIGEMAMTSRDKARLVRTALPALLLLSAYAQAAAQPRIRSTASSPAPISFEENRGQTSPAVKFVAKGKAYTLFLTADET